MVIDNGFTDEDWDDLFYYIKEQSITPFLGSGIARDIFGTGSDLAKVISDEFGYPFSDTDNLSKVAQFAAIKKKDSYRIRKFVADYIRNKKLPDFDNPHEPHRILSELDLPLYITTNYDHSMYESLIDQGKKPVIEYCRWNDLAEMNNDNNNDDDKKNLLNDFTNTKLYDFLKIPSIINDGISDKYYHNIKILIFDQFEEFFTSFIDNRFQQQKDFFQQIKEAINQDPNLRIVFIMREEYIAFLDNFSYLFPDGFRRKI